MIRYSNSHSNSRRNGLNCGLIASFGVTVTTILGVYNYNTNHNYHTIKCDNKKDEEPIRFDSTLSYHRLRRKDYEDSWHTNEEEILSFKNGTWSSSGSGQVVMVWPSEVPQISEISALEYDLKMCKRSPNYRNTTSYCNTVQFNVASALLNSSKEKEYNKGLTLMKDLAESGHPDGMCGYGLCLMLGRGGLESNPTLAVGWFRRCVEMHNHSQAMYELGVALYIGEGVVENEEQAARYFRKAAKLGNVAAAYMYGECLLDGVGVIRDRAKALTWLVRAAQSGHKTAQSRVLAVLDYLDYNANTNTINGNGKKLNIRPKHNINAPSSSSSSISTTSNNDNNNSNNHSGPADELEDEDFELQENMLIEKLMWQKDKVQVERRYTCGGSSPAVLARRRTIVQESRKAD